MSTLTNQNEQEKSASEAPTKEPRRNSEAGSRGNGGKKNDIPSSVLPFVDPVWFCVWLGLAALMLIDVLLWHWAANLHASLPSLIPSVLIILLSFFDVKWTTRKYEVPLSTVLPFGLAVAFAVALPISEGKPSDVGIYMMGLAALVIGIRHLTDLHKTSKGIQEAGEELKHTQGRIEEQSEILNIQAEDIKAIRNLIGFSGYRKQLIKEYATAKKRIVSVVRLWEIDDEWWEEGNWEECPIFKNLCEAKNASVKFIGRMPWPSVDKDGKLLAFPNERDFNLFLGITWRLVLLAKVCEKVKEKNNRRMRIIVADVPVPVTVVDFTVGMLVGEPKEDSLGSEVLGRFLTEEPYDEAAKNLANTYDDLVQEFLVHSGTVSGEQYVASVLYTAGLCGPDTKFDIKSKLFDILKTLGFERWAKAVRRTKDKERVIELFEEFLLAYYAHDAGSLIAMTFNDLKKGLA